MTIPLYGAFNSQNKPFRQNLESHDLSVRSNESLEKIRKLYHLYIAPRLTLENANVVLQGALWLTSIALTFHPVGMIINTAIAVTWALVDTVVEVKQWHKNEKNIFSGSEKINSNMVDAQCQKQQVSLAAERRVGCKNSSVSKLSMASKISNAFIKNFALNAVYLYTPPVAKGFFRVASQKFLMLTGVRSVLNNSSKTSHKQNTPGFFSARFYKQRLTEQTTDSRRFKKPVRLGG